MSEKSRMRKTTCSLIVQIAVSLVVPPESMDNEDPMLLCSVQVDGMLTEELGVVDHVPGVDLSQKLNHLAVHDLDPIHKSSKRYPVFRILVGHDMRADLIRSLNSRYAIPGDVSIAHS